jgi:hydroxymethylbilane synthase
MASSESRRPASARRARATSGTVRIATRASELALRQARLVQAALTARGVTSELKTYKTTGDKRLDEPLNQIGAKGLFTKELEDDLLKGKVDCCVHSLKDLPTESPPGLEIVARLEREDPRDVLVFSAVIGGASLADLPRGSRVGTSSLRRRAQLLAMRPDLDVVELRGNVPTRLRKVDDGQVHAAILAAAGLHRLDVHQRIGAYLEPPEWLPAAGQGAIAVQTRADDPDARALFAPLDHAPTSIATAAERAMLGAMQGGCQVPIGALAIERDGAWTLHGLIADAQGRQLLRGQIAMSPTDPTAAGRQLALELLNRGAWEILGKLRTADRVPSPQPE